jgi:hypothetical protein
MDDWGRLLGTRYGSKTQQTKLSGFGGVFEQADPVEIEEIEEPLK